MSACQIVLQLSAGLEQALILHLSVSVPYLFSNVTSFHYCKISICAGTVLCFQLCSFPNSNKLNAEKTLLMHNAFFSYEY